MPRSFKSTCQHIIVISLLGPSFLFFAVLSGADLLDGIAGGSTSNTTLENTLLKIALIAIPVSLIAGLGSSVRLAVKYRKIDKRYLWLPLIAVATFVVMGLACWRAGLYGTAVQEKQEQKQSQQQEQDQSELFYDPSYN